MPMAEKTQHANAGFQLIQKLSIKKYTGGMF